MARICLTRDSATPSPEKIRTSLGMKILRKNRLPVFWKVPKMRPSLKFMKLLMRKSQLKLSCHSPVKPPKRISRSLKRLSPICQLVNRSSVRPPTLSPKRLTSRKTMSTSRSKIRIPFGSRTKVTTSSGGPTSPVQLMPTLRQSKQTPNS